MQRRFRMMVAWAALMGMILTFSACGSNAGKDKPEGNDKKAKIMIETSFYAIGEFARAVGGDKVEVHEIVTPGTEPHDFEPKAMDIARLADADIFAYNGLGMESWEENAVSSANNPNLIVVDTSKGADLIKIIDAKAVGEHGQYDPHLWLSLKGAEKQAQNIKNALAKADPANKVYYEGNYRKFNDKLEALFMDFKKKFTTVQNRDFITGHAAFAYLCRDFNLTQNSVADVFAEGEPTANKLGELVDYCKKNRIRTVFTEEMASPKVSQTLAREVGAKVVPIHTAEASEDGLDYIGLMEYNLNRIYDSLKQ